MWRERQQQSSRTHVRQRVALTIPHQREPETLKEWWWQLSLPAKCCVVYFTPLVFLALYALATIAYIFIHDYFWPMTDAQILDAQLRAHGWQ
ncbi:hypothetical protein HK28_12545 [Acetobacter sp. DsW_063]|nr:hypothetical protein HK28_12545 [Acetobacter sp. DsW_063]